MNHLHTDTMPSHCFLRILRFLSALFIVRRPNTVILAFFGAIRIPMTHDHVTTPP